MAANQFRKTPDGRLVFFPWGRMGSGYVIESERDFNRLRAQISLFTPLGMILPIATYKLEGLFPSWIALACVVMFYWVWMRYALHGLQKWQTTKASGSGNAFKDAVPFHRGTHSPVLPWTTVVFLVVLILLVAGGGLIMFHMLSPANPPTGTADIVFLVVFFSLSAIPIAFIVMLGGKRSQ